MQFHIVYPVDAIVRPKLLSLLKQLTNGFVLHPVIVFYVAVVVVA